jgi:hypothetical protein
VTSTPRERRYSISEISITVKYGKGYDETWAGFRGSVEDVREDITSYFGLDSASVTDLTLNELVINVTQQAHGVVTAVKALGGKVITKAESDEAQQPSAGGDPWTEAEKPADPLKFFQDAIEAATTKDALKLLWAENQAVFADKPLMDAWKAKGKALSA